MDISELLNKLIEFIYDEYNNNDSTIYNKQYGMYADKILSIDGFLGNAELDNLRLLKEKGWIHIVKTHRNKNSKTTVEINDLIKITDKGIQRVENIRQPWIKKNWGELVARVIEGLTSSVIKIFKKD
jgi:hypothetical protein